MQNPSAIKSYNLCIVGFGNVGRAAVRLLEAKRERLRAEHGIEWRLTGVASRRLGWMAKPEGFEPAAALADEFGGAARAGNVREWLAAARGHVLFETTSLNAQTGQPAIEHLRAALHGGAHAISANKGPVVHAYEQLTALARERGRGFFFESSVMDGVPIFSLFRETLPVVELRGFYGVLNSTTNVILEAMEAGGSFEDGVRRAQQVGVAETDPTDDVEGWDAAVKVAATARVLMGAKLKLEEIEREGIRGLSGEQVRAARAAGTPYKLVARAWREDGRVRARVRPEPVTGALAEVKGTSSYIYFETDVVPGLAILEENPGLETTAYGLVADFVRAVRGEGGVG